MINLKGCYLVACFALALTNCLLLQEESNAMDEKKPKGKSLILVEPMYDDFVPEYVEPTLNYGDANVDGDAHAVISEEMEDAESSIVFRPLFAYRKKLAQRQPVHLENKIDQSNVPKRRRYYYYYGHPVYYHSSQFEHVA
ncbi:hypothetical protein FQA39_LY09338 [Lamprigera yunnana]|nr:hypothetical protein FQA39_LY09338 [Lamprigera yunnana]